MFDMWLNFLSPTLSCYFMEAFSDKLLLRILTLYVVDLLLKLYRNIPQ